MFYFLKIKIKHMINKGLYGLFLHCWHFCYLFFFIFFVFVELIFLHDLLVFIRGKILFTVDLYHKKLLE